MNGPPLGPALGPASLVRAAGVAVATLVRPPAWRAVVLAGSYGAAWSIKPGGLTFLSMTEPDHDNPVVRAGLPLATSGASWTAVHLGVTTMLRRLGHPLLAGAAYGVVVAVLDTADRAPGSGAASDESVEPPRS